MKHEDDDCDEQLRLWNNYAGLEFAEARRSSFAGRPLGGASRSVGFAEIRSRSTAAVSIADDAVHTNVIR